MRQLWFKTLVELSKRPENYLELKPGTAADVAKHMATIAEDAHLFCFESFGAQIVNDLGGDIEAFDLYSLPFRTCCFEALDGPIFAYQSDHGLIEILASLVLERSPGSIFVLDLMRGTKGNKEHLSVWPYILDVGSKTAAQSAEILNRCIGMIVDPKNAIGTESVRIKVKVGVGASKRHYVIRRIVRVAPKSLKDRLEPAFSTKVDWSHRWEVRGHWRRVDGVGKDRGGEYVTRGFTWVKPFTKGPQDMPLIDKKVRVVVSPPEHA